MQSMQSMQSIKQYLINLKRRPDRLQQFYDNYPFEKTSVEVIYGFDGKNPENENINELRTFHSLLSNNLMPGEKGCFISHLRIYQDMIDKNIPLAVVMEDDAIFCENFKERMNELVNEMPNDFQILYFGGRFQPEFKMDPATCHPVSTNIVSYPPIQWNQRNPGMHDRTTHGYIISRALAIWFMEQFRCRTDVTHLAIDNWMVQMCMDNSVEIKILSANPLLAYSPWISDSDIR
jgi:GR25 family glycosyltransferase involved in LPS biosynthesis